MESRKACWKCSHITSNPLPKITCETQHLPKKIRIFSSSGFSKTILTYHRKTTPHRYLPTKLLLSNCNFTLTFSHLNLRLHLLLLHPFLWFYCDTTTMGQWDQWTWPPFFAFLLGPKKSRKPAIFGVGMKRKSTWWWLWFQTKRSVWPVYWSIWDCIWQVKASMVLWSSWFCFTKCMLRCFCSAISDTAWSSWCLKAQDAATTNRSLIHIQVDLHILKLNPPTSSKKKVLSKCRYSIIILD